MELAISDWNVLLFTEIQGGSKIDGDEKAKKQDDHLLEVMKNLALH